MSDEEKNINVEQNNNCFVIMPISDPDGYEPGHFKCVYEDIFKPAIESAGFIPKRADDDKSSSLIQVNIIKDIIESPMAICDLSSRNPNVLFELGIRQAYDLPVVLVQEIGTPRIFDVNVINTTDYHKRMSYREVLNDRNEIKLAIEKTKNNKDGINSIIKLSEIGKAEIKESTEISSYDKVFLIMSSILQRLETIEDKIESNNITPALNNNATLDIPNNADILTNYLKTWHRFNHFEDNIEAATIDKPVKYK